MSSHSLYTSIGDCFSGLKGQKMIAQGKRRRSVALGWEMDLKIVRVKGLSKSIPLLGRNRSILYHDGSWCRSIPSEWNSLLCSSNSPRLTGLGGQGGRFFPLILYPRLKPGAIYILPLRGKNTTAFNRLRCLALSRCYLFGCIEMLKDYWGLKVCDKVLKTLFFWT